MTPRWTAQWARRSACALMIVGTMLCASSTSTIAEDVKATPRTGGAISDPRAAAHFRAAATHQDNKRYDLGVAEWQTLIERFPVDPLVAKAFHYRGVCLARLEKSEEAAQSFREAIARADLLGDELLEPSYANLGFALHNRARLLSQGDARMRAFDEALTAFDEHLRRFPDGEHAPEVTYYRAEALYAQRRPVQAIAGYRNFLQKYPRHALRPLGLYGLGAAQQELQDPGGAARSFAEILQDFPYHEIAPDVHLRRGEIDLADKCLAEAADHFLTAATSPGYPRAARARTLLMQVAKAAQEAGNRELAAQTFDDVLRHFGSDPVAIDAYQERANLRASAGNFRGAARDFARISERWPESALAPQALLRQAELEARLGDPTAAQITLGRFLVNYRDHALSRRALFLRATAYFNDGQYAQALADLGEATERTGTEIDEWALDALFLRGRCQSKLGRYREAAATMEEVLQLAPNYAHGDHVLRELAAVYESLGDARKSAWSHHRLVHQFAPSSFAPEAWFQLGEWHFERGQYGPAARSFRYAVHTAGDESLREISAYRWGMTLFHQRDFDRAADVFNRQLGDAPDGIHAGDARLMLAASLFELGDYDQALSAYEGVLSTARGRPEQVESALLRAMQAAAHLSAWERGRALAERFLREYPESGSILDVRMLHGEFLYHLGELEEASAEFSSVISACKGPSPIRARFMLGEIALEERRFDDAVRIFFQVAYGGTEGNRPDVAACQADSLYKAAECLVETKRYASARKIYHELLERFPNSEKAQHARIALDDLKRRIH